MGSVTDKLDYLADTKEAIKNAIEAKGVEIASTATFRSYADSIDEIQSEAAYEIDTSKVNYSIGSNTNVKTNNGRILQGFATMTNNRIQPLDTSGDWLNVDWTKDWEIGVAFKMVNQLAKSFILGTGYSLTYPISESPCLAIQDNGTIEFWIYQDNSHYTDSSYYIDGNSEIVSLDTWYHVIIKHDATNTSIVFKISKDMKVYTTLETLTMTQYYNNRAALILGGLWQNQSTWSTNNLLIDTYNTYIKDDSGKIIWGAFAKSFDNGKYPIISGEYELYDYIESDGTQIIDMGFAPKNGDEIEVNTYLLSTQTEPAWIWAATDPSIFIGTTQYSNYKAIYTNSSSGSTASYIKNDLNMDLLTASRDYTAPLCIFGFKLSGTYYPGISTRLYSVRCNNNYYLPCKRKSDGIFGLYDVANKAFLTDALNGNSFVGGNPIGNFDIFPKKDLSKYSITVKAKEVFTTGGSSVYTTKTYTFDEDGFYFVGFSGWNNGSDGNNTSLTYSGEYTEYFTATSNKALKSSIVYAKAGTIVTMYIFGRYLSSYAIYKINGVSTIGNKLKEFTDVSPQLLKMSFDDIVSDKVLACVYYTEGSKDGQNANLFLDFIPKTMDEPINLNHTTVIYNDPYPNSGSGYTDWRDRVGIFFFEASSIGTVVSNIAGFGTRLFQVFEIE